jgi:DNA-binding MarR family transcriptional regulator
MVSVTTKHDAIREIEDLLARIATRMTAEDGAEQQWLADHCSPEAARHLPRLSVHALHLLDAIPPVGSGDSVNIVGLSQATGVPKGTVSKTVSRLAGAGLVARHRIPGNRKEVHLRATETGTEIQRSHQGLHAETGDAVRAFLARYTAADLSVVTRVLSDLSRMPREGVTFRPDLLD